MLTRTLKYRISNIDAVIYINLILIAILSVFIYLCLSLNSGAMEVYASTGEDIEISISDNPAIDVVLTKNKTNVDLSRFSEDLIQELEAQGINTSKVNITALEQQEVNIEKQFQWERDISSAIGSISITNNGQNVKMYGNTNNAGKNAIWIIPDEDLEQEFSFGYNIDFGDSFNAAGMLLRVLKTGNTLKGYMLSFNKSNRWATEASGANAAIWEFTYVIGQNTVNMTKTLKKELNINISGTLTVKVTDGEIIVSGGGLSTEQRYVMEQSFGPGFGFFSDHYSHSCSNIGSFELTNIGLSTSFSRKFKEILLEPEWTENSLRFLVNVTDLKDQELENSNYLARIATLITNNQVNYIGWGISGNQAQMQSIIAANNNNGICLDNGDYAKAIKDTVSYIKNKLSSLQNSDYIIAGSDIVYNIAPEKIISNTEDFRYPNGRWRAIHDASYFENSNGQYSKSGRYTSSIIESFPKVGKYDITYEDNLVKTIYAHRKPIAAIDMVISNTPTGKSVLLNSLSYDLDAQSNNNGISQEEWSYQKVGTNTWTSGKLTSIQNGETYIVMLRVKDHQGVWSDPVTKIVTTDNTEPVAIFNVVKSEITKYDFLEIIDTSYDPNGLQLTKYLWKVYKDNNLIYSGSQLPLDYKQYGLGSYKIGLVVTNSSSLQSEEYIQRLTVTEDAEPPEVIADIREKTTLNEDIVVNVNFIDFGGSGFKRFKYAISESDKEPTNWSEWIEKDNMQFVIDQIGYNYIHLIAEDNVGNASDIVVLGNYYIKNPKFNLTLEKVDESNEKIKLGNVEFIVIDEKNSQQHKVTTDGNGNLGLDLNIYKKGEYTYRIKETKGQSAYKELDDIILKVSFDEFENIVNIDGSINDSNSKVSIKESANKKISLLVKNEKYKLEGTTVTLISRSERDREKLLEGITYRITATNEKGETESLEETTDVIGRISLKNLLYTGNLDIEIEQITGIDGYKVLEEKIVMRIYKDPKTGEISIIRENSSNNLFAIIYQEIDKIEVIIDNKEKDRQNRICMQVTDAEAPEVKLENIEFEIEYPYSLGKTLESTNESGVITFNDITGYKEGDYLFTIRPVAPELLEEYDIPSEIKIIVTFDKFGEIIGVQEMTSVLSNKETKIEEDETTIYMQAELMLALNRSELYKEYKFKLSKSDKTDSNIKLEGVTYKIKIQSAGMLRTYTERTDAFGELLISLPEKKEMEIMVQETKTLEGYILNEEIKTIALKKDNSGNLVLNPQNSSGGIDIKIDNKNSTILLNEVNERKITENNINTNISIYLNKIGNNNTTIGNVEFEIYEETTNQTFITTTDKNGNILLPNFKVPDEGRYVFYITETKTSPGYILGQEQIVYEVIYERFENIMKTTSTILKKGYSLVYFHEANEYETDTHFQLDLKFTVTNDANAEGEQAIEVLLNKTGKDGLQLPLVTYQANIIYEEGFNVRLEATTDENGKISIPDIAIPEGQKTIIELTEIKTVQGYKLDEETKVIQLAWDDGQIKANGNEGLDYTIENNEILKINLKNELSEDVWNDEMLVESEYIDIVVNKVGEKFEPLKGVDFNVILKAPDIEELEDLELDLKTNANGQILISDISIGEGQRIIAEITETGTTDEYILDNETKVLEIERKDGKIIIIDDAGLEVDIENNKIIEIEIQNEKRPDPLDIIINKIGEDDNPLKGVMFDIEVTWLNNTEKEPRTMKNVLTDSNGQISMNTIRIEEGEIIQVEIKETRTIDEYILNDVPKTLQFMRIEGNIEKVDDAGLKAEIQDNKTIDIEIQNEKRLDPLDIIINKMGEANNPLKGVMFDVKVTWLNNTEKEPRIMKNTVTGANGQILINTIRIEEGEIIQVEIKETRTIEGYILDDTLRTLKFTRLEGNIEKIDDAGLKIEIEDNKLIEIEIENEKDPTQEPEPEPDENSTIDIIINKVGEENKPLRGVTFDITTMWKLDGEQQSTKQNNVLTNANGQISIDSISIEEGEIVQVEIKETDTVDGYILNNELKVVKLSRNKGQIVVLDNAGLKLGIEDNEIVQITIKNEKGLEPTDIIINKTGERGSSLRGVIFDIELNWLNNSEKEPIIMKNTSTNANGLISINSINIEEGEIIQVEITETATIGGYILDDELKIVKLSRSNGQIVVLESAGLKVGIEDNKIVQIKIENKKEEEPEDLKDTDGDGVPDKVEIEQGTDPNDPNDFLDSDGDGVPDYVEIKQGTDPNNPNDYKDSNKDGVPDYVENNKDNNDSTHIIIVQWRTRE